MGSRGKSSLAKKGHSTSALEAVETESNVSSASPSYPPELAPSRELLDAIRQQKGAGITVKYEEESDLYCFIPKKTTVEKRPGSPHRSALFSVNKLNTGAEKVALSSKTESPTKQATLRK